MSGPASTATIVMRLAKVVELALDDLGLTTNQYRALTLIDSGAPPLREFAVRLAMHPPNVSTLVDGLAGRGLVVRRRDPKDGRRILLSLTASGRALLRRAETRSAEALSRVAAFDHDHQLALLAGIDDWEVALDRVADDLHERLTPRPSRSA